MEGVPLIAGNFTMIVIVVSDNNGARMLLEPIDLLVCEPLALNWADSVDPLIQFPVGKYTAISLPALARIGGFGMLK